MASMSCRKFIAEGGNIAQLTVTFGVFIAILVPQTPESGPSLLSFDIVPYKCGLGRCHALDETLDTEAEAS